MKQEIKDFILSKMQEGRTKTSIAKELGININTIEYNINAKANALYKKNSILRYLRVKNSKDYGEKRRKYMRNYMVNRYHTNPEFRKRLIQLSINHQKRKKDERRAEWQELKENQGERREVRINLKINHRKWTRN